MRSLNSALLAFGLMAAPLSALAATAHTVPWYLANPGSLRTTLAACAADPGALAATPDCVNAGAATKAAAIAAL